MYSTACTLLLVIILIALAASILFLWNYRKKIPTVEEANDYNWFVRKAKQWEFQAQILRTAQVGLVVVAIMSSVLSASLWQSPSIPGNVIAVIAAIAIALLTGLNLTNQANKIRNAWRHLIIAILKNPQDKDTSLENLLKAYEEAETIVGDYNPQLVSK